MRVKNNQDKIKFVLIDAFMDVILGADENSVKDVLPGLAALKKIIEETGVSFLIIHHKTKPSNGNKGNYRGSSAIKGAVDLMIEINKTDDSVKFETTKFRDGEFTDFKAKMFFTDFSFSLVNDDGLDILSDTFTKGEKFVLQFLIDNGISQKIDIEQEAENQKIKRTVHSAFTTLVQNRYIIRTNPGDHKACYAIIDSKKDEVVEILQKESKGNLEKYM